jgi:hypothetical protein
MEFLTLRPPSARAVRSPKPLLLPSRHPDSPRWQGRRLICGLIGSSDFGINPTSSCLARLVLACEEGQVPIKRESIAAIGEDENPQRAVFD